MNKLTRLGIEDTKRNDQESWVKTMGKVRPLSERKYNISKHRFWELYHHCLQYNEWKKELRFSTDTLQSPQLTGMPHGTGISDATSKMALRRLKLSEQCELLENTAREAAPDIWEYILKGATNEYATFKYLKQQMNIPCGKNYYYERRRKFYWLLSERV